MVETRRYFYPQAPAYPEAPRHALLKQHIRQQEQNQQEEEHDPVAPTDVTTADGLKPSASSNDDDGSINDPELGLLDTTVRGHHRMSMFQIEGLDLLANENLDASRSHISLGDYTNRSGASRLRLFSSERRIPET